MDPFLAYVVSFLFLTLTWAALFVMIMTHPAFAWLSTVTMVLAMRVGLIVIYLVFAVVGAIHGYWGAVVIETLAAARWAWQTHDDWKRRRKGRRESWVHKLVVNLGHRLAIQDR